MEVTDRILAIRWEDILYRMRIHGIPGLSQCGDCGAVPLEQI